MKKILALLLAAVMCLSLVACGGNNETKNPLFLYPSGDETPALNVERLSKLLEIVELTTENWREYLKVYSYSVEIVETDAFGEVTSSETNTYYQLGAGNERYHCFEDVAIELKNKATGELTIYEFNHAGEDDIPEDFDLDNYECTRIKGRLCFVDLPEEVFYTMNDYICFNLSEKSLAYYTLYINDGTKSIQSGITPYLD